MSTSLSSRLSAFRLGFLFALVPFAGACALTRPPLALVTPEEASLAPAPVVRAADEDLDEGPIIQLISPEADGVYRGPFPIRVEFRARPNGEAVDRDSLKIFYRKIWDIDITERLSDYMLPDGIEAPAVELPSGRHTVRIYLEDVTSKATSKTFSVKVQD